jgi:hypothetical protein
VRKLLTTGARTIGLAATALLCAVMSIGCGLAILFELDGFGRPRDAEPRLWYVALLALGLVASAAVPVSLLARRR